MATTYAQRYAERHTPTPAKPPKHSNSRDIMEQGEARLRAQLLVDSLDRDRRVANAQVEQLPAERLSAADMLTNEELLELDEMNRREAHVTDQLRRMYQGLGTWVASHPEFPAGESALTAMVAWGRAHGLNVGAWGVADRAWEDLQRTGDLRADYSKANVQRHEVHLEQLRAAGFDVHAVDVATMSKEELDALVARGPHPSLNDSLLIDDIPDGPEPAAPVVEERVEDIW